MALHQFGHHSITQNVNDIDDLKQQINELTLNISNLKKEINDVKKSHKSLLTINTRSSINLYGYFYLTLQGSSNVTHKIDSQTKAVIFGYELENGSATDRYKFQWELSEEAEIVSLTHVPSNIKILHNGLNLLDKKSLKSKYPLKKGDTLAIDSTKRHPKPFVYLLIKYKIH